MTESGCVLPREKFSGHLIMRGQSVPVVLAASAGRTGALELDVEPITAPGPSGVLLALRYAAGRPGDPVDEGSLDCRSCDGKRLTSERVYLTSCSSGSAGTRIKIRAREASLAMAASETFPNPQLRFRLLGFKCHPPVYVDTEHGQVVARGALQTSAFDEVTGWIAMEGSPGSDPSAWREAAERVLTHVRSVLAFARGAPLPAPVREFCVGNTVCVTFREKQGGHAPLMPPLPHLDLQPLVAAAVANIDAVDACREAFELAIGWLVVPTIYEEVRFLSGMIALESVTYRSLEPSQSRILGSSAAARFAKLVKQVVDEQEEFDDFIKSAIKGKIGELNRHSQIDMIEALLACRGIARAEIDRETLLSLLALRNKLVHQGAVDDDLWHSILVIREVLVRLVLSMLRFEGNYWCYVGGRHMRRFPGCERIDTP